MDAQRSGRTLNAFIESDSSVDSVWTRRRVIAMSSDDDASETQQGMDSDTIELLPNEVPTTQDSCLVCLDAKQNKNCIRLPCLHTFHKSCVKKWLKDVNRCPLCRYNVTKGIEKSQTYISESSPIGNSVYIDYYDGGGGGINEVEIYPSQSSGSYRYRSCYKANTSGYLFSESGIHVEGGCGVGYEGGNARSAVTNLSPENLTFTNRRDRLVGTGRAAAPDVPTNSGALTRRRVLIPIPSLDYCEGRGRSGTDTGRYCFSSDTGCRYNGVVGHQQSHIRFDRGNRSVRCRLGLSERHCCGHLSGSEVNEESYCTENCIWHRRNGRLQDSSRDDMVDRGRYCDGGSLDVVFMRNPSIEQMHEPLYAMSDEPLPNEPECSIMDGLSEMIKCITLVDDSETLLEALIRTTSNKLEAAARMIYVNTIRMAMSAYP